jgi:two-component system response regulator VicR
MATILVAEDDPLIQEALADGLRDEGFAVIQAWTGPAAIELVERARPDLVLLDVMLPERNGWDVCREIRRASTVPVLMLTARGAETDRVLGLELGADDYIVKPFSFRELVARIRASLRRVSFAGAAAGRPSRVGGLEIDVPRRRVRRHGQEVDLTPREFEMLRVLLEARGAVVPRERLLDRAWGPDWIGDPRTVDVHVRWLREKLEDDPAHPRLLLTARGVGYRLRSEDEA